MRPFLCMDGLTASMAQGKVMKKKQMMLLAMAVATLPIMAATEVVDGITWTYKVSSGKAFVDGGSYSKPAVPITTTGNLTIPAMLGGYPVTSIGSYAFRNCIGLTRVTIGAGVTSIGSSAFSGCGALMSVMISNSVKEIGDNAFAGCTSLWSMYQFPQLLKSWDIKRFLIVLH